ncbi:MAG: class I SAM-dependent methyltransferase [Sandaracinaceae bacterium]
MGTLYDRIGEHYASRRREDPRIAARIHAALGDARTVVNVGAGTGSYEPLDRVVVPVEPSVTMAAQRPPERPAIRGRAEDLPLHDRSVDAAMTVLSVHHWHPSQRRGIEEMRRVARDRLVVVTIDAEVSGRMWLMADYLREVATLDLEIFPALDELRSWIGWPSTCEVIPVPRDVADAFLLAFWAHPEWVLDAAARNATSGFRRQTPEVVQRVVDRVREDLGSGRWDERYGHLRSLPSFDAGLRLVTAVRPGAGSPVIG